MQSQSPDNIRIANRQAKNRIIWSTEPWKLRRLLFLTHPSNRGGCVWCGNIASVVEHDDWSFYGTETYIDLFAAGCVPMCVPCNRAKRRNKILCPRCRRQGHYCFPGDVCWDCRDDKEDIMRRKIVRLRLRRTRDRAQYNKFHPTIKVVDTKTGKWVSIKRPDNRNSR